MRFPPRLWRYPKTILECFSAVIGFVIFWLLIFPLWMIFSRDAFIYLHAQAMFYNPWVIWEEYDGGRW